MIICLLLFGLGFVLPMQTAMAFRVIQNALSVVVTQIRTLASLASEVDRLHFLLVTIDEMRKENVSSLL